MESPAPELLRLAWPIAVASLAQTAMGLVDTALVGRLGPAATGGVAVAGSLIVLALAAASGLGRGIKISTARAASATLASSDPARARAAQARAALILGIAAGVVLVAVLWP